MGLESELFPDQYSVLQCERKRNAGLLTTTISVVARLELVKKGTLMVFVMTVSRERKGGPAQSTTSVQLGLARDKG